MKRKTTPAASDNAESLSAEDPAACVTNRVPDEAAAEAERFVRDLLARGEAAKAIDGKLPKGATHEIVAEPGEGESLPKVVRRRFSAV